MIFLIRRILRRPLQSVLNPFSDHIYLTSKDWREGKCCLETWREHIETGVSFLNFDDLTKRKSPFMEEKSSLHPSIIHINCAHEEYEAWLVQKHGIRLFTKRCTQYINNLNILCVQSAQDLISIHARHHQKNYEQKEWFLFLVVSTLNPMSFVTYCPLHMVRNERKMDSSYKWCSWWGCEWDWSMKVLALNKDIEEVLFLFLCLTSKSKLENHSAHRRSWFGTCLFLKVNIFLKCRHFHLYQESVFNKNNHDNVSFM